MVNMRNSSLNLGIQKLISLISQHKFSGFDNITFILLDEGARRDLKDNNGNLAYDLALKGGHQDVIELFEAAAHGDNSNNTGAVSVDTGATSIGCK